VLRATHWIADHGARLLGDYVFHPETGEWTHRSGRGQPVARLGNIQYGAEQMRYPSWEATHPESALDGYLREATDLVKCRDAAIVSSQAPLPASFEELRWFPLAGDGDDRPRPGRHRPRIRPNALHGPRRVAAVT
jgi:hypothetical protein